MASGGGDERRSPRGLTPAEEPTEPEATESVEPEPPAEPEADPRAPPSPRPPASHDPERDPGAMGPGRRPRAQRGAAGAGAASRSPSRRRSRSPPTPARQAEQARPRAATRSPAETTSSRRWRRKPTGREKPGRATRIWPRFFAACLAIVGSIAAATAISVLVFLDNIADGFGGIPRVQAKLADVKGGDPQNILILGSDKRPGDGVKGRSDTTLLVRVDPDTDAIALLSIPRDLKVDIPGYGTDKFNVAYSLGGPALTLEVTKKLLDIDINHVINIDFTGFADAVDAIDCVYLDVDRHYFNDNSLAATTLDQYAEIDVEAGYQRLCGYNALQYVRYRHEDTDLVRSARQQDFLREARQKIDPKKLLLDVDYRNRLVDVFKKYTTSDDGLRDPIEVLALIKTFLAAREAPVSEVHFPAQLGGPRTRT